MASCFATGAAACGSGPSPNDFVPGGSDDDQSSNDNKDHFQFHLTHDEMAISFAPTLTRPDGTVVEVSAIRPYALDVDVLGDFKVSFVIDSPSADPSAGEELFNYGIEVAFKLGDNDDEAPATYKAVPGDAEYDSPADGTAITSFDFENSVGTDVSGEVALDTYVKAPTDKFEDGALALSLNFKHLSVTTKEGIWLVSGTLLLRGTEGGIDGNTPPGGGDGDGDGDATGCLTGTWKSDTCGGAKEQKLIFDGANSKYTNPDCNDICTDLIFPFTPEVTGNSVTLHYTEVTEQPDCNIDNPPLLMKPTVDDTFTFECVDGMLSTTTSTGTTTYHR
jgi:hypothetical protein